MGSSERSELVKEKGRRRRWRTVEREGLREERIGGLTASEVCRLLVCGCGHVGWWLSQSRLKKDCYCCITGLLKGEFHQSVWLNFHRCEVKVILSGFTGEPGININPPGNQKCQSVNGETMAFFRSHLVLARTFKKWSSNNIFYIKQNI